MNEYLLRAKKQNSHESIFHLFTKNKHFFFIYSIHYTYSGYGLKRIFCKITFSNTYTNHTHKQNTLRFSARLQKKENNGQCLAEEFQCNNGVCIDARRMCDGYNDCLQGEDETQTLCGDASEPTETGPDSVTSKFPDDYRSIQRSCAFFSAAIFASRALSKQQITLSSASHSITYYILLCICSNLFNFLTPTHPSYVFSSLHIINVCQPLKFHFQFHFHLPIV